MPQAHPQLNLLCVVSNMKCCQAGLDLRPALPFLLRVTTIKNDDGAAGGTCQMVEMAYGRQ